MNLFNDTFTSLEKALNYTSAKNRAISDNIANIDTPGYQAKEVSFKSVLEEEQASFETKRTNARHYAFNQTGTPSLHTFTSTNRMYNHNGNNVDVDKEMNELAQNQIQHQALVERLNGKFKGLESVLRGGN
ncbi:flagellar basal body rod protein FlgB [Halobacillus litoralis]|uniref:flagellar basal body rod protein FlgB n=1 Tax=Halobacillus litoralis TaxID=45668 RepID=UPI001CFD23C8|nr:flagellar basal body rod protein FlgB [Halobacillus litoralis]